MPDEPDTIQQEFQDDPHWHDDMSVGFEPEYTDPDEYMSQADRDFEADKISDRWEKYYDRMWGD